MKPKNLPEFKALIKRYETITLEEIKEIDNSKLIDGVYIAEKLTGFGSSETCTLCHYVNRSEDCNECIYVILTSNDCNCGDNEKTYYRIYDADIPLKLRNAFRARAKHMKTLIK